MCGHGPDFGHGVAQPFLDCLHIGDPRDYDEALPAAMMLAQQSFAHDHLVPFHNIGPHRQPVDRRGLDRRQFAQARHRHLQSARDRRGSQRQHVHIGPQRLQRFLVSHPEALLFINDYKPKPLEAEAFCQQRVGTDHHVASPIGQTGLGSLAFFVADQPRQPPDSQREPGETLGKVAEVLAREQGSRRNHRNLLPGHRRHKRGAQGDLGLAKTDIAANQPVHRTARGKVAQHIVNRGVLIVGFLPREALDKLVVAGLFGSQHGRGAERAQRSSLEQFVRNRSDPLFQAALALLPAFAAQPVERGKFVVAAIAAERIEVFNRHIQLIAPGILQHHTVVRALPDRD